MYTNMYRQSRNRETRTQRGRLRLKGGNRRTETTHSAAEPPRGKRAARETSQPGIRRKRECSQKRGHAGADPQQTGQGRGQDRQAKKNPHRHCCRRGIHHTTTGVSQLWPDDVSTTERTGQQTEMRVMVSGGVPLITFPQLGAASNRKDLGRLWSEIHDSAGHLALAGWLSKPEANQEGWIDDCQPTAAESDGKSNDTGGKLEQPSQ